MEGIDSSFPFMRVPARPAKPRISGLTVVSDMTLSLQDATDLMETSAEIIDYVKFTDHAANIARHPEDWLQAKIGIYHNHQIRVLPGGVTFQVAVLQKQVEPFFQRLKELDFDAVEISDDVIPPIPRKERLEYLVLAAKIGLQPFSEVGRKDPTAPLEADETIDAIRRDLEAGAKKVTIENSDLLLLMKTGSDPLHRIVDAIGPERLVFEIGPHGWPEVAVWVIRNFGQEVNLENLTPEQVATVDAMRRGMHRNVNYEFLSVRHGRV